MKKKITLEDINETLKTTYDVGLGIGGNLIFCDPAETQKTAMESLKWLTENTRYIIRMAMVGFHPGTVLYRDAVTRGQITRGQNWRFISILKMLLMVRLE